MANIRKRGNSYQIRVSCGYTNTNEQVVQSMTWKPDEGMTDKQIEKELQRQAVLFEESCMKGHVVAPTKFQDYAEQWFKDYAELKLKKSTIQNYHWLEKRVYKAIGHLRLDKITARHIQKFIRDMSEGKRNDGFEGTVSPKTIKLHVSFISTVFDHAMRMQLVSGNPCKAVTLPRPNAKEREVYTLEEAQRIVDLLSDEENSENFKYAVFFILAIYTGFRRGELLGLMWQDIDFANSLITVSRTLNTSSQNGIYTDTPKTKTSCRTLKLPQEVSELLSRFYQHQKEYIKQFGDKYEDSGYLFTRWNGLPVYPDTPMKFFKKLCKRNGIRALNVHSLRHLNASLLINGGVDVKTVQAYMGHSSPTTTLSIYTHYFQSTQAKAMEAVANAIGFKSNRCPTTVN